MPIHLFELSGRPSDVDAVERVAPAWNCSVRRQDGGIYLASAEFNAASYTRARALAEERLEVFNALALLGNQSFRPLTLGSALTFDDQGNRSITVHPAFAVGVASVSLDAALSGGAAAPPPPRRSFDMRAVELAQRDVDFLRALKTYRSRPLDPSLLYHVAEILAGGQGLNALLRYGIDPNAIERFKSVHDHGVFGPTARHGHRGGRAPRPQICLEDAGNFVREAFRSVVDHEVPN